MKPAQLIIPAIVIIIMSCKDKAETIPEATPTQTDSSAATDSNKSFLPVADFIREDIRRVDSFGTGILKKRTINGKKDSTYIQPSDFHSLANVFLRPELDPALFVSKFTETSLADQTTKMLDFVYSPKTDTQSLQKVIVFITPSPTLDKVDRIYMERQYVQGDTTVRQKLTWRIKHYFYILSIIQPKNGKAVTKVEKVIWEPQDFYED